MSVTRENHFRGYGRLAVRANIERGPVDCHVIYPELLLRGHGRKFARRRKGLFQHDAQADLTDKMSGNIAAVGGNHSDCECRGDGHEPEVQERRPRWRQLRLVTVIQLACIVTVEGIRTSINYVVQNIDVS